MENNKLPIGEMERQRDEEIKNYIISSQRMGDMAIEGEI